MENIDKSPFAKIARRIERIESIVETREGFLVGLYENSPNAEIIGFSNPQKFRDDFIRKYLGNVLSFKSLEVREYFLNLHRALDKTFIVIGQKKPEEKKDRKKNPDIGMLIGGGNNPVLSKTYATKVGFIDPLFVKSFYEIVRKYNLAKEEDDGRELFWPNDYWKKFGLKDESWVGTTITHDNESMKILDRDILVKEFSFRRVFRQ